MANYRLRVGATTDPLPAWITSQTINTWGAIPASNMLADLNPDDDPLVNPNHPLAAPWRVTGGHDAIVRAWSGAAFDDAAGVLWWTDAGGHGDGLPNGAYKLDMNRSAPLYTRVRNPSGSVGMDAVSYDNMNPPFSLNYAEMEDGRPRAHHTLNYPFYWPGLGPGLASEIIIAPSGGSPDTPSNRSRPAIYSPTTGERTTLGANKFNNASGGYDAACYDGVRQVVWKVPSSSGSSFVEYWGGPSNDVWTPTAIQQYFSGPCSLCHSPGLDVILIGNGGNDLVAGGGSPSQSIVGGFGLIDPATGTLYAQGHTATFPTFTGAPATAPNGFATGLWPGLCQPRWSATLGAFLAWHMTTGNTTQIMKITPPASGSLFTGTWAISYLTVSGSNAETPSAAQPAGTYGRFFVWDAMGICGVINAVGEAGYFFRYA